MTAGVGSPLQNRDLSANCLWYQHSCFVFPALCLSDSLFTARRLTRVPAKTAAVIFVSTDVTVSRGSVANKSSALFSNSSIVSCGVGTSNAVRNQSEVDETVPNAQRLLCPIHPQYV